MQKECLIIIPSLGAFVKLFSEFSIVNNSTDDTIISEFFRNFKLLLIKREEIFHTLQVLLPLT